VTLPDPHLRWLRLLCLVLAGCLSAPALCADESGPPDDELRLRGVGVSTDGAGLLAFFKDRKASTDSPRQVEKRAAELIERLGGKDLAAAQAASGQLVALGAPAIPLLRQAARNAEAPQAAALARLCLEALETHPGHFSSAAVRLLGRHRPKGAAAALLGFLPLAEDEEVIDTVRATLGLLAHSGGQVDPALVEALHDENALRRAVAIDALCQQGIAEPRTALSRLLRDPVPSVRLRAAVALARARDAEAVRLLIDLLAELPLPRAREAEELLIDLAGSQAPSVALTADESSRQTCRDAWQSWWKKMDERQLLEEVRSRTLTDDRRRQAEKLIGRLEDDEFEVREQAQKSLIDMGMMILPLLRKALSHRDRELEGRRRLRLCIQALERDRTLPLPLVAPRLLAIRKPPEAVAALLAFVPFADSDELLHEVHLALNALAADERRLQPAFVRALDDAMESRRGAAAEAICLSGHLEEHWPALRKLLRDPSPAARLQTALALAGSGRREAMPVVIDLLGELPREQVGPALDYLQRLAQDRPPPQLPQDDSDQEPRRLQEVWKSWWAAQGEHVALVPRYAVEEIAAARGITVLVNNTNQVVALDRQGKERWSLKGLLGPQDAQLLGANRVLVAEAQGQRVTERNLQGDILWKYQIPGGWPMQVERLPGRNTTFIVCRHRLVEVDHTGREVLSILRPQQDIACARKMRNGEIVALLTHPQVCVRLSPTGQEIRRFAIMPMNPQGSFILPSGNVLTSIQWMNKVQEFDTTGKKVWEANAFQPVMVCRADNGNTLVWPQQMPWRILELDRQGEKVGELPVSAPVVRMHRR
jgi:HEAT repeat protein